jgi:hypothetical protein
MPALQCVCREVRPAVFTDGTLERKRPEVSMLPCPVLSAGARAETLRAAGTCVSADRRRDGRDRDEKGGYLYAPLPSNALLRASAERAFCSTSSSAERVILPFSSHPPAALKASTNAIPKRLCSAREAEVSPLEIKALEAVQAAGCRRSG